MGFDVQEDVVRLDQGLQDFILLLVAANDDLSVRQWSQVSADSQEVEIAYIPMGFPLKKVDQPARKVGIRQQAPSGRTWVS
jgi:hypothetical protein